MKILKKILIVVAIIIAIPFIMALFISNDYSLQREITINKPKQEVFNYVKIMKNQTNYNKWWMMDPNVKMDMRGTDGTVGFVAAWDSPNENVGKGEQEIKAITEGELVDCALRFYKPFESSASTAIRTEAVSETQTKVKWSFSGNSKYPMNFMNLFMANMLGPDLEKSLQNLKGVLEK